MQPDKQLFVKKLIEELLPEAAVFLANQGNPKQVRPFVTLQFMDENSTAMNEILRTEEPGILNVKGHMEQVLAVNYYGSAAMERLAYLKQALDRPTIIDRCFAEGIAFFNASQIRDLTILLDNRKYEKRANLELFIRFVRKIEDNPGWIETVRVNDFEIEGGKNNG